jgi:hypothetical protein
VQLDTEKIQLAHTVKKRLVTSRLGDGKIANLFLQCIDKYRSSYLRKFPPSPINKLSLFPSLPVSPVELTYGRGGVGVGGGAESCDRVKAWPSINHSIPSEFYLLNFPFFTVYCNAPVYVQV